MEMKTMDPSFTGESGGNVRYMASPDINAAALDTRVKATVASTMG